MLMCFEVKVKDKKKVDVRRNKVENYNSETKIRNEWNKVNYPTFLIEDDDKSKWLENNE